MSVPDLRTYRGHHDQLQMYRVGVKNHEDKPPWNNPGIVWVGRSDGLGLAGGCAFIITCPPLMNTDSLIYPASVNPASGQWRGQWRRHGLHNPYVCMYICRVMRGDNAGRCDQVPVDPCHLAKGQCRARSGTRAQSLHIFTSLHITTRCNSRPCTISIAALQSDH